MRVTATLQQVLLTHELATRAPHFVDDQALSAGLLKLTRKLSSSPHDVLQCAVEVALDLCRAQTVGLSMLEVEPQGEVFRWRAMAGSLASALGSAMARNNSPCGMVIDANAPLMFAYPEHHFPFPGPVDPPIREVLLMPFHDQVGIPVGTLWVVAHNQERKFDAGDLHTLTELTSLVTSALTTLEKVGYVQSVNAQIAYEIDEGIVRPRPAPQRGLSDNTSGAA